MRAHWLWWVARIFSGVVAVIWIGVTAAYVFLGSGDYGLDFLLMILVVIFSGVSVSVAWWRAGLGAILLFISAVLNSIFGILSPDLIPMFAITVSGGPFLIAAILFGVIWLRSRKASPSATV